MIDHIGLSVTDYERSKAFYLAALAPLGYEMFMEIPESGPHAGFGANGKPNF
jgi:catechol 2,3-dioxygenase-like lactoylglutathione lyase family enzyme